jgi:UDP-2,4-diacetamido-2,4,6-trideoxy-beta-L-altropyranose hydrolase
VRQIVIRADAGVSIGSGHVMRCLALAQGLSDRVAIRFMCRDMPGNLIAYIEAQGFPVSMLKMSTHGDATDVPEVLAAIGDEMVDWMIVDHYGLDAGWERAMRARARRIMVIDDAPARTHDCDLLLDQNVIGDGVRYDEWVTRHTRQLLGPRYALLRPEFATASRDRSNPVQHILIFFGGSDLPNATGTALAAVAELKRPDIAVDIVVGSMYAHGVELEGASRELPNVRIHRDADMADLMRRADVAIGAGGTASWERCAAGLPTVTWSIADNQRPVVQRLSAAGAVVALSEEEARHPSLIARHLSQLIADDGRRAEMSKRARSLCDGLGVSRVVAALHAFDLSVRAAVEADCEMLHRWRNDPLVRTNSTTTDIIDYADHQRWFAGSLQRPDRLLLIGEVDGEAVGVVRFDRVGPATGEVSIYLNPERLGEGIGTQLLSEGEAFIRKCWPEVSQLLATVKSGNVPSQRLFVRTGFTFDGARYRKELLA